MTDGSLSMMYVPFASFLANGAQPQQGNEGLSGRYACYQIYETKDGRYLSLGALEHKFWENACRVLGREDFIGKCFNDGAQEEMIAAFRETFKTRTAAEWLAAFENVDTCVALVNDIAEMIGRVGWQQEVLMATQAGLDPNLTRRCVPCDREAGASHRGLMIRDAKPLGARARKSYYISTKPAAT